MEFLQAVPVDRVGVGALLVVLFFMLATGRLYTSKQVEGMKATSAETIADVRADRDVWRDNFLDQKGLMSTLLTNQETTNKLLRSLPRVGDDET